MVTGAIGLYVIHTGKRAYLARIIPRRNSSWTKGVRALAINSSEFWLANGNQQATDALWERKLAESEAEAEPTNESPCSTLEKESEL